MSGTLATGAARAQPSLVPSPGLPGCTAPVVLPAGPDVAYTPDRVAERILDVLSWWGEDVSGRVAWEMHAGGGAFVRAMRRRGAHVLATDAVAAPGLADAHQAVCRDARAGLPAGWPMPAIIAGNPPWSEADEHLKLALEVATDTVAWVLPWAWLLPAERSWVTERAMPDLLLGFRERVSYGGPGRRRGSPPRDSALHVWRKRGGSWAGRGQAGVLSTAEARVYVGGQVVELGNVARGRS